MYILPQMVSLSNNSRLTQSVALMLKDKLEPEELLEFNRWLVLANQTSLGNQDVRTPSCIIHRKLIRGGGHGQF